MDKPLKEAAACVELMLLTGTGTHEEEPMLEQFVPEVPHPMEWTSAGAVLQELQPVGGTHAGAEAERAAERSSL